MAFKPELSANETVEENIDLVISKKPQLRLVLTSKAVYWPGKRAFAFSDPVITKKAEHADVISLCVGKKKPVSSLFGGMGLILLGVLWTLSALPAGKIVVGMPQGLIVGGILLFMFGHKRTAVELLTKNGELRWSSPVAFGKKFNEDIERIESALVSWARKYNLYLKSE